MADSALSAILSAAGTAMSRQRRIENEFYIAIVLMTRHQGGKFRVWAQANDAPRSACLTLPKMENISL